MNRLLWVRHGEDHANIKKIFSHRKVDLPLTEKGVVQAKQTAAHLAGEGIHRIYSSPMKRALQTAEIIAHEIGLNIDVIENFREVNIGILDSQPMKDEAFQIHQEIIADWFNGISKSRFPGGEDYLELWGRMKDGLVKIFDNIDRLNVIVVAHGGSFKYILKDLCKNIESEQVRDASIPNCSISDLKIGCLDNRIEGRLITLGDCSHLYGKAAVLVPGLPPERTDGEGAKQ